DHRTTSQKVATEKQQPIQGDESPKPSDHFSPHLTESNFKLANNRPRPTGSRMKLPSPLRQESPVKLVDSRNKVTPSRERVRPPPAGPQSTNKAPTRVRTKTKMNTRPKK